MFTSFKRILKFGGQGFWRNKGLSAQVIFIMMVAVFAVTFFFFFRQLSYFLIEEAQKKVDISVYFKKEISEDKILEVKDQILQLSNYVKNVDYTSQDKAKDFFVKKHEDDPLYLEALEYVGVNPFLASLDINAKDPNQYAYLANFLQADPFKDLIEKISYNKNKGVIEKFFSIISNVEKVGLALSIILALLVILVTFNTIKLSMFTLKGEISTGRLVGASNWFLRGPFLIQGVIYAVLSVLFFNLALFLIGLFFNSKLQTILLDFNLLNSIKHNFLTLFAIQFAFILVLAVISSFIAVHKHLKV